MKAVTPWADDLLAVAGVVCFGVGIAETCPPWALWFYAGAVCWATSAVIGRS